MVAFRLKLLQTVQRIEAVTERQSFKMSICSVTFFYLLHCFSCTIIKNKRVTARFIAITILI